MRYDLFRKEYKKLHDENADLIKRMKSVADELAQGYFQHVNSREMSLAITNLEQAMMWATKAIVLADEDNGGKPVVTSQAG